MSSKRNHIIGFTLGALGGFFFNFAPCIAKYLSTVTHISGSAALLIRGIFSSLCIGAVMVYTKTPLYESTRDLLPGMAIGMSEGINILFYYMSLEHMSVGTTGIIYSSMSPFTLIFGFLFLRERCSPLTAFFGFISLCGIALVLAPGIIDNSGNHSVIVRSKSEFIYGYILGIVYGFCSVALKVFCLLLSKKVIREDTDYKPLVLYQCVGYIVAALVGALCGIDKMVFPPLSRVYWMMLISGGFTACMAIFLQSAAMIFENAGIVSFLISTEVIWAYVYDVVIAHQIPNKYSVVGIVVTIVFTALLMFNRVFQFDKQLSEKCKCCETESIKLFGSERDKKSNK